MLKRIRQFRAIQARRISTASSPYDNYTKLRAFPFHVRPEEAQKLLAVWAAVTCTKKMEKFWPSICAYSLPFLNLDFLRPARFSAVYFPAWFVTGEIEASVTFKGIQVKGSAWFENTYIPGSHSAVLSAAPLSISPLTEVKTVPFTTSLMHQHGEPVQCIPFSTSPFSVLDIAASHSPSRSITIKENLSIDLSSVKSNLISAHPVLLPLYLAQYEIEGRKNSPDNMFTFFIKAHEPIQMESLLSENLSKIDLKTRTLIRSLSKFVGHESSGEVNSFFFECPRVSMPYISMPQRKPITKHINDWLEELLSSSKNIEILAESSLGAIGKGDEDLRMREMTSEEEESLKMYAERTNRIMVRNFFLNTLLFIERNGVKRTFANGMSLLEQRKVIEEDIKRLEAERVQFAPKWWSEWLSLNRPVSENTKSHVGDGNVADGTRPPPKDSDNLKVD